MPSLTEVQREERRKQWEGKYKPSKVFNAKRAGQCTVCGQAIPEGEPACFRYFEGLGPGTLCHTNCVNAGESQ